MIDLIVTTETKCPVTNGSYSCVRPEGHDKGFFPEADHAAYYISGDGRPAKAGFADRYGKVSGKRIAATLSTKDLAKLRQAQRDVDLANAGNGDVLYCLEQAAKALHDVLGGYDG